MTVIGSNGAGKSTLLNALAGDVRPEQRPRRDRRPGRDRLARAARAGLVARVFQDPLAGSCEALSIEENLALAAARGRARGLGAGVEPERCASGFAERLARLGLGSRSA